MKTETRALRSTPLFACVVQVFLRLMKISHHMYINGKTILYLRSVDPRKLCIGVKYYIVHMYSMPYYTYGSTANFLILEPTELIYISKERRCNEDQRGVRNF